jgi:hypothetical protein
MISTSFWALGKRRCFRWWELKSYHYTDLVRLCRGDPSTKNQSFGGLCSPHVGLSGGVVALVPLGASRALCGAPRAVPTKGFSEQSSIVHRRPPAAQHTWIEFSTRKNFGVRSSWHALRRPLVQQGLLGRRDIAA